MEIKELNPNVEAIFVYHVPFNENLKFSVMYRDDNGELVSKDVFISNENGNMLQKECRKLVESGQWVCYPYINSFNVGYHLSRVPRYDNT
jgi:hypothetical protein